MNWVNHSWTSKGNCFGFLSHFSRSWVIFNTSKIMNFQHFRYVLAQWVSFSICLVNTLIFLSWLHALSSNQTCIRFTMWLQSSTGVLCLLTSNFYFSTSLTSFELSLLSKRAQKSEVWSVSIMNDQEHWKRFE